jgi:hypothetical protein
VNGRDRHDRFFHIYAQVLGESERTGAGDP